MEQHNTGQFVKKTANGDGLTSITWVYKLIMLFYLCSYILHEPPLNCLIFRCTNMPESLLDANNAKKHFSKFGKVTKIILRPKKQMCVIEYDLPASAKRALLNAGAYDGFMFDVVRTKNKM